MKQEEMELWKGLRLSAGKLKLDLEKTEFLLIDLQGFLQKRESNDPQMYQQYDLHRIWVEVRNLRLLIDQARQVHEHLSLGIRALETMQKEKPALWPSYLWQQGVGNVADF